MRALVVEPGPRFSVQDVHDGWVQGLAELGVDVRSFNLSDRIEYFLAPIEDDSDDGIDPADVPGIANVLAESLAGKIYLWAPDLVIVTSSFFIPAQMLDIMRARAFPAKLVAVMTESPYEDGRQLQVAQHFDAVVLNDPTNIERFADVCPSIYLPHAHDPLRHTPGPAVADFKCDVGWVGTAYRSRLDLMESVDWSGLDVLMAGNFEAMDDDSPLGEFMFFSDKRLCLPNEQTVELYRSAKTSFNMYRKENHGESLDTAVGWAMGPREVELAATGCWFARESRPESDLLFPMLPTFTDARELGDILRWAVTHDRERAEAADAARAAVAGRTFANNARQLLELLGA